MQLHNGYVLICMRQVECLAKYIIRIRTYVYILKFNAVYMASYVYVII